MFTIFLLCAVIAGTVFIFQFVMTLVGFGLEGADIHTDLPQDTHVDFSGHGDADGGDGQGGDAHAHHGSNWIFAVISVRTVVAALTFFGLAGMAALSALGGGALNQIYATLIALLAGAGAMFGVHFVMRTLYRLGADGTVHLRNSVGETGKVYLSIPAAGAGQGKVHVRVQGRLVELAAVTSGSEPIATGRDVKVVGTVGSSTVDVVPLQTAPAATATVGA